MQGVVHRLINGVFHGTDHGSRTGILIADQVIEHGQLRTFAHFLGTAYPCLCTVTLNNEHLPISVLELPADIRKPNFRNILFQEVRVIPTELQILPHVLDPILNGVRHIQSQVNLAEARDLTVGSDIQEQVFPHHRRLGNPPVTQVDDPVTSFGQGVQHVVMHQGCLVFFPFSTIHQLDKGDELQGEVTRHIPRINGVVRTIEVVLNLPRHSVRMNQTRPFQRPKAAKLGCT